MSDRLERAKRQMGHLVTDVLLDDAITEMKRNAMVAFAAANHEAFNAWVKEVGVVGYKAHFAGLKAQMEKTAAEMKNPDLYPLGLVNEMIEKLGEEMQLSEEEARSLLVHYAKLESK